MRPAIAMLVMALLLGWSGCSARAVEEEEPPDIEGLCREYCGRSFECAVRPGELDTTAEDCTQACIASERWAPECADLREDMLECQLQFHCPEFALARAEQCEPEILAHGNCWPEERP